MDIFFYAPLLLRGAMVTVAAWILASSLSLCIGSFLGIIGCRYLVSWYTNRMIKSFTFIAKGIPAFVQILIVYFVLPLITGINLPGFVAATLALGICSGGYVTDIVKAGMNAIPREQWEACLVLGYPLFATLKRIIVPQAFKMILPALFGEFEQLLKSTSLLATIGVTELTRSGMNIISRELNPLPVYGIIACIYLLFSFLLRVAMHSIEQRTYRGDH